MKKLFVALALVVLMLASSVFLFLPQVEAQSDTSQAKIISYSWYIAPDDTVDAEQPGDLVVVGEVQNVGSKVLGTVIISGNASDSNGNRLNSAEGGMLAIYLNPKEKAPFYLDFTAEGSLAHDQSWISSLSSVTLDVTYVDDTSQTFYSDLTVPSGGVSASLDNTGTYAVTGTVQNTGNQPQVKTDVWVFCTFYNAAGTVVGLNATSIYNPSSVGPNTVGSILPGDSATFVIVPTDNKPQLSSSISNYSLLIQAFPTTTYATSTPPPSSTPSTFSALLIAAVLTTVIILVILALLLVRRRRKST